MQHVLWWTHDQDLPGVRRRWFELRGQPVHVARRGQSALSVSRPSAINIVTGLPVS